MVVKIGICAALSCASKRQSCSLVTFVVKVTVGDVVCDLGLVVKLFDGDVRTFASASRSGFGRGFDPRSFTLATRLFTGTGIILYSYHQMSFIRIFMSFLYISDLYILF